LFTTSIYEVSHPASRSFFHSNRLVLGSHDYRHAPASAIRNPQFFSVLCAHTALSFGQYQFLYACFVMKRVLSVGMVGLVFLVLGVLLAANAELGSKTGGLCDSEITALSLGKDGSVWIGTSGGVCRYRAGRFTCFVNRAISVQSVCALEQGNDGQLWIGYEEGLWRLEPATGQFTCVWDGPTGPRQNYDNFVTCLHEGAQKSAWFGTRFGLYRWSNGGVVRFTTREGLSTDWVQSLFGDAKGNLWILAGGKLHRFQDERCVPLELNDRLGGGPLRCLYEDREGNLWIGSAFWGLTRLQAPKVLTLTTRDGLCDDDVWSICQARDGSVWVATGAGISHFKDGVFTTLDAKPDTTKMSFRCVFEYPAGGLWFGAAYQDYWFYNQATGELKQCPKAAVHPQTAAIYLDRSSNLWIGSKEGLTILRPTASWLRNPVPGTPPKEMYGEEWIFKAERWERLGQREFFYRKVGRWYQINKDVHKTIDWPDLIKLDRTGWTTCFPKGTMSSYNVRAILEDKTGTVWLATAGGGLNRLLDGTFSALTTADGLVSNVALALYEDCDGALWIGTQDGLSRYKDGRFATIDKRHGLFDNLVNQILEDDHCDFWMGCHRGIYRVNRQELNAVAEGRAQSVSCIAPEKVRFKYRLQGHDADWIEAGARRVAYYTNMRPGTYRFQVIAANHHGVWNETGASFAFQFAPYFYQTWLFKGLCAVALLLGAYGVHVWLGRRERQLELLRRGLALAEERARIARDQRGLPRRYD
jgi:ligand-binding sensor domain-containing protein